MKVLSFRQPWCDGILYGGKRIENRTKWKGAAFRGEVLLHASKKLTNAYYAEVLAFLAERGIAWRPAAMSELVTSAVVGQARVVDVIMPAGLEHAGEGYLPSQRSMRRHRLADDAFYMGAFALVLEDVRVLPKPIPCKGALGFFEAPADVMAAIGRAA